MFELSEGLGDISWHGEMDLLFFVVPIQSYANVPFALPVLCDFVVLFESVFEVDSVFFSDALYSKSSTTKVN